MLPSLEDHYAQLLGLSGDWSVTDIELDSDSSRIVISVDFLGDQYPCPECGTVSPLYDQRKEARQWRHLDTMQFETIIQSRICRVQCPEHGVKSMVTPWAGKHSRFTLLFEGFAIRVLQSARSVEEARKLLQLNWHQLESIKCRAVERGLSRRRASKIRHIGIDEKAHRKGHRYVTLVNDLSASRVLEVVESRTQSSCEQAITGALSKKQQGWVEAVSMDMWPAYINAVEQVLPDSDIVHDRFHIAAHLNQAVDLVRKEEHRRLLSEGDERLKKSRYLWLHNEESLQGEMAKRFKALKDQDLKVSRAWAIKESFRRFWEYASSGWAKRHFERWYAWAIRSRLPAVKKVAKMIKRHLPNLLTWFTHSISNAVSEGLNSKIQTVKANARGYRSFKSYRTAILFYCGKLDMAPEGSL